MMIVRIPHQVPSSEDSTFTSVFQLFSITNHWEPALLQMVYVYVKDIGQVTIFFTVRLWITLWHVSKL